jgi:general secretion pathway protein G
MGSAYFAMIQRTFEVFMRNRQRGFTLIEIMVVVVILAVLGALVVPNILGKVDTARVTAAKTDINSIKQALDLYRLDNFKYPTTEQGLQALVKQPADPTITNYPPHGYLSTLPKDPWGNPYIYTSPGADGREFEIMSYGRDGKPGGEGPDADILSWTQEQK